MKHFIVPLLLLLSIFTSTASAVIEDSLGRSTLAVVLHSMQPQKIQLALNNESDHCEVRNQSTFSKMTHSTGSMPADCKDSFECCAQLCVSQIQLHLHSFISSKFVRYSYIPQQHNFLLVQGVKTSIDRPPKA